MTRKPQTQLRLSDEGRYLLAALSKHYGDMAYNAVVELSLREKASDVGIESYEKVQKRRNKK